MTTLKKLNRYIRRTYPVLDIKLVKGKGNYHFVDCNGTRYPQSEIHCKCLSQQSNAQWTVDIDNILNGGVNKQ